MAEKIKIFFKRLFCNHKSIPIWNYPFIKAEDKVCYKCLKPLPSSIK